MAARWPIQRLASVGGALPEQAFQVKACVGESGRGVRHQFVVFRVEGFDVPVDLGEETSLLAAHQLGNAGDQK